MGWSEPWAEILKVEAKQFQSLRGFGVGWSLRLPSKRPRLPLFQSLRGFGVGWSQVGSVDISQALPVSIPERVWGGLEQRYIPRNF